MADTCTKDDFNDNSLPLFPTSIILLFITSSLSVLFRCYVYYLENFDVPPQKVEENSGVSYGLGARVVVKLMCALSLAIGVPNLILYFAFRNRDDYTSQQIACQVQDGFVYIAPIALTYSITLIIFFNFLRYYSRHDLLKYSQHKIVPASGGDTCI